MACEQQQDAYDQALAGIDTAMADLQAFDAQAAIDRQQLVWALNARQAQATMAWILLDQCWRNNGGPPGVIVPIGPGPAMTPQMIFEQIEQDRMERSADSE